MNDFLRMIPPVLMIVSPILITAAGGMVCERSGVVNIALKGLMSIGAFAAAASHVLMEANVGPMSVWYAILAGGFFAMLFSFILAFASITLNADQTISGTGINLLASGVTIFLAQILFSMDRTRPYQVGMMPMKHFFGIYPTAFVALFIILFVWFMLYKLPFGLRLRACGEHLHAAASVGVKVRAMRYFAAVSFGRWRPAGITGSSLLFGSAVGFSIYVVNIPTLKNMFPSEFFNLLPYAITLVALVVFSGKNYAPLASGKAYEKGAS